MDLCPDGTDGCPNGTDGDLAYLGGLMFVKNRRNPRSRCCGVRGVVLELGTCDPTADQMVERLETLEVRVQFC